MNLGCSSFEYFKSKECLKVDLVRDNSCSIKQGRKGFKTGCSVQSLVGQLNLIVISYSSFMNQNFFCQVCILNRKAHLLKEECNQIEYFDKCAF